MASQTHTSKFLSLILRHEPARFGVALDGSGWASVESILAVLASNGHAIGRTGLESIVRASDKQRFALSDDGTKIRANQGHSVDVELGLAQLAPPDVLYHGTVERFLASIRACGLIKGRRHHVHLSADIDTARTVAGRRGAPVVLVVRAAAMAEAGYAFFRSANGVWLTEQVPPAFLDTLDPGRLSLAEPAPAVRGPSRGDAVRIARATLAACDAGAYDNAAGERQELAPAISAAVAGTRVYDRSTYRGTVRACPRSTRTEVTSETVLAAIERLADRRAHVACLNFASAKRPGGGFLGGAIAQEETLARSSALYPCLQHVPEYYERNQAHGSALYLDLAIWSPQVPFLRADDGRWFDEPIPCSVITCAAPNAGALRQHGRFDSAVVERTLIERSELVLSIARDQAVDELILGAWGAGVFRNDPEVVARAFRHHLDGAFSGVFGRVTFAMASGSGDANHDAFATAFPA